MNARNIDRDRQFEESNHTTLERTLIAEYLLAKGYLMSELKELPPLVAKSLMKEACRHAALKMAEIESRARFRNKIRPPVNLN